MIVNILGTLGIWAPPKKSSGQGAIRTTAGGSRKLKWLATMIKGPEGGKFSSPTISKSVSSLKPNLANHCKNRRIGLRRGKLVSMFLSPI
jgi:hypothetical protein